MQGTLDPKRARLLSLTPCGSRSLHGQLSVRWNPFASFAIDPDGARLLQIPLWPSISNLTLCNESMESVMRLVPGQLPTAHSRHCQCPIRSLALPSGPNSLRLEQTQHALNVFRHRLHRSTTFHACTAPKDPEIIVGTVVEWCSSILQQCPELRAAHFPTRHRCPRSQKKTSCVVLAATCWTSEPQNAVVVVLWVGSLSPECSVGGISRTWIRLHRFQAEACRNFDHVGQFQDCPPPFARNPQCSPNHPQQQQCLGVCCEMSRRHLSRGGR